LPSNSPVRFDGMFYPYQPRDAVPPQILEKQLFLLEIHKTPKPNYFGFGEKLIFSNLYFRCYKSIFFLIYLISFVFDKRIHNGNFLCFRIADTRI
jgi:hypothetical protein